MKAPRALPWWLRVARWPIVPSAMGRWIIFKAMKGQLQRIGYELSFAGHGDESEAVRGQKLAILHLVMANESIAAVVMRSGEAMAAQPLQILGPDFFRKMFNDSKNAANFSAGVLVLCSSTNSKPARRWVGRVLLLDAIEAIEELEPTRGQFGIPN